MATPQNTNPPSSPETSPATSTPVGFVFEPNSVEIFCHFFPLELSQLQLLPHPFDSRIQHIDLYANISSPHVTFATSPEVDITDFYFFTTLKPKTINSNKKSTRLAGNGVWKGERPTTCFVEIQGQKTELGTKRLFKYEYTDKDEKRKFEDMGVSWNMHEYSIDKDLVNSWIKRDNIDPTRYPGFFNKDTLKNTVFCHVKKKVVDKKRKQISPMSPMLIKKPRHINNSLDAITNVEVCPSMTSSFGPNNFLGMQEQNNMMKTYKEEVASTTKIGLPSSSTSSSTLTMINNGASISFEKEELMSSGEENVIHQVNHHQQQQSFETQSLMESSFDDAEFFAEFDQEILLNDEEHRQDAITNVEVSPSTMSSLGPNNFPGMQEQNNVMNTYKEEVASTTTIGLPSSSTSSSTLEVINNGASTSFEKEELMSSGEENVVHQVNHHQQQQSFEAQSLIELDFDNLEFFAKFCEEAMLKDEENRQKQLDATHTEEFTYEDIDDEVLARYR